MSMKKINFGFIIFDLLILIHNFKKQTNEKQKNTNYEMIDSIRIINIVHRIEDNNFR
jgi:hypothetical protein